MNIKMLLLWLVAAAGLIGLPAEGRETAASWLNTLEQWIGGSGQSRSSAVYSATVESVHDGDTLRVRDSNGRSRRVRMAYIDAPELQQAYGQAARDALRGKVLRQKVQVEVFDQDQYRREVAKILLNGEDVNQAMIAAGHAWHYESIAKRGQNRADFAAYAATQRQARQQKAGLWQNRSPQAPWQYRKAERAQNGQ